MDKEYQVDANSGIFIVAYPNKDVDTDIGFEYWVGPGKVVIDEEEGLIMGMSAALFYTVAIVGIILIITCMVAIVLLVCKYFRNKRKIRSEMPEDDIRGDDTGHFWSKEKDFEKNGKGN